MTSKEDSQGFTVKDKRAFNEEGEARKGAETPSPAPGDEKSKVADSAPPGQEAAPGTGAQIDFPSYVLSYYTQGLVLMGEVPNPYTNKKEEDLEAARHTVDILSMLQTKTKGNLSREEDQLLDSVLYELRMKYMAKTSRIKL
jgi:hypothetical protein